MQNTKISWTGYVKSTVLMKVVQPTQSFVYGLGRNVLDFYALIAHCGVKDALEKPMNLSIQTRSSSLRHNHQTKSTHPRTKFFTRLKSPLPAQLNDLDYTHEYLAQRGLKTETAKHFGVGFFTGPGPLHGRIVFPIHNERGELVAYAGRSIDGSEPKYKFSTDFPKSIVLYNLQRVKPAKRDGVIYIVEGFSGVMKLEQAGFRAVALMGSDISEVQIELLARNFTHAVLLFDEDQTGADGSIKALLCLSHFMYVTTGCLSKDLGEMTDDEIRKDLMVDVNDLKKSSELVLVK